MSVKGNVLLLQFITSVRLKCIQVVLDHPFQWLKLEIRHSMERTNPANISTLFQRCLLVDATSRRGTTSNQRCVLQR